MSTSLAFLSADVVSQILSYNGVTHSSILLWKCGDLALQRKLEQSVTIVELRSYEKTTFGRVPLILPKFRTLRELRIDRKDLPIQFHHEFADMLSQLSPTLLKLELRFDLAHQLFYRTAISTAPIAADSTQNDSTDALVFPKPVMAIMDVKQRFPNLNTLHIFSKTPLPPKLFTSLPSSITELGISLSVAKRSQIMQALPKTIQKLLLQLVYGKESDLKLLHQLPPHTTEVDFMDSFASAETPKLLSEAFDALPKSLTNIIGPIRTDIGPLTPEYLHTIHVYSTNQSDLDWRHLPRCLTSLTVPHFIHYFMSSEELRQLPRTLRYLSSSLDFKEAKPGDLPPGLTTINGLFNKSSNFVGSVLPASLRSLSLHFDYYEHQIAIISDLPSGITELDIPFGEIWGNQLSPLVLKLPSSITSLKGYLNAPRVTELMMPEIMAERPCEIFSLLPSYEMLAEIELRNYCFPLSAIRYLPRFLRSLEVKSLFKDGHFDAIAMYEEKTKEQGFVETERFRRSEATFLDLLPKTMKKLIVTSHSECFMELPAKAWRRAPHFETLRIETDERGLNGSFLLHLPAKCLKTLITTVDTLRDEHVAELRREMHLDVSANSCLLTEACIPRWPVNSYITGKELSLPYHEHFNAVTRAVANSDLTIYYESMETLQKINP